MQYHSTSLSIQWTWHTTSRHQPEQHTTQKSRHSCRWSCWPHWLWLCRIAAIGEFICFRGYWYGGSWCNGSWCGGSCQWFRFGWDRSVKALSHRKFLFILLFCNDWPSNQGTPLFMSIEALVTEDEDINHVMTLSRFFMSFFTYAPSQKDRAYRTQVKRLSHFLFASGFLMKIPKKLAFAS